MSLAFARAKEQHLHQFAINWIDNLVEDLDRRALGRTPLAPIHHPRLAYWKTLRPGLESCKDDSASRFQNVKSEFLCPRHWDAIRWVHSLVLDAQLSTTTFGVCKAITRERLEEWQTHRAALLECEKPHSAPTVEAQTSAVQNAANERPAGGYNYPAPPSFMDNFRVTKMLGGR